jgi:hypothetical protein
MDVKLTLKFDFGDIVYLKTDPDQFRRIITGIVLRQKQILYYVSLGATETAHFDYEITLEKDTSYL